MNVQVREQSSEIELWAHFFTQYLLSIVDNHRTSQGVHNRKDSVYDDTSDSIGNLRY